MALTDDDYNWIDDNKQELKEVEAAWKKDVAKTQTDEFLLDTFPEAQEIIPLKLDEYWMEAKETFRQLLEVRNIVDRVQTDPFSKWFFTQAEKYKEGSRLKWLYQQIRRLIKMKIIYEKRRVSKQFLKEEFKTKEERKRFDIDRMFLRENLLSEIILYDGVSLKRNGERHFGLCPFHNEKTPSFFIYPGNWAHCFGCGWHGNFIDYLLKKRGYSFKEALIEANEFV